MPALVRRGLRGRREGPDHHVPEAKDRPGSPGACHSTGVLPRLVTLGRMSGADAAVHPDQRAKWRPSGWPLVCHARVRLAGLQVEHRRGVPPELAGAVIPWVHVRVHKDQAALFDEQGERSQLRGRPVYLRLRTARERRTAAAAARAALRRAWRLGTLDLRVPPPDRAQTAGEAVALAASFVAMLLLGPTVLVAASLLLWRASPVLPSAHRLWVELMCLAAAGLWVATAGYAVRTLVAIFRQRRSAMIVRMTRRGVTAIDREHRHTELVWTELRRVHPRAWPARLVFEGGEEVLLPYDQRARQVAELACAERLGDAGVLRRVARRRARDLALPICLLTLITLTPALSGPFGGGRMAPLPIVWPVALAVMAGVLTAAAPDLMRRCEHAATQARRRVRPLVRSRRRSRR